MSGDLDNSVIDNDLVFSKGEERITRWTGFVIGANIIFGIIFFILGIWLVTQFVLYAFLPPLNILMLWASYSVKNNEINDAIKKGLTPRINRNLDILAFVGNLVLLFMVIIGWIFIPDEFVTPLIVPLYGITALNFETLGSSLAFIRVTRHN
jgi:hypothetical protein